jgi:uncharacterized protein YlzI (FlbEa/FlbD family)
MIRLTKLNAKPLELDPDFIERVEVASDTVLTMVDGAVHLVRERLPEIVSLVRDHQAGLLLAAHEVQTSVPPRPTMLVALPAGNRDPTAVRGDQCVPPDGVSSSCQPVIGRPCQLSSSM